MSTKRYLITGGAGFLGINLCRYLLARGRQVRTLDIAPFDYPERGRVEVIDDDIRNPGAVGRAMAGMDVIVHAAAALPLAPPEEIRSTGIQGTRCLLEEALRIGVPRFIFISSTAVYGIPKHHPLLETDPMQGVGPYGEAKVAGERLCSEFRDKGLCTAVLRPKTFVGPERLGIFELLYDWAYTGHNFPVLGSGANRYQLLDVDDLCEAIELCATGASERVSGVFNVAARDFGTMRDNIQAVLDRAGHGRHAVSIPAAPAIAVLRLLAALRLSPLYPWIYDTAAKESFVSIDRIGETLGFAPRYSAVDALLRNYDWYVAHRGELGSATGVTHRVPWKKGLLSLAKAVF
jgi:nucleoside-diphosphate-sugar epimerase